MSQKLAQKPGSVLGGILLIAGSCIGAGMLALPVITGSGGFLPASVMFLFAWLFMTTTALLLLQVNVTLGYQLSLVSLAEKSLGKVGKAFCWILFLFLFYSLGIAYISASGSILETIILDLTGKSFPSWLGSLLFTLTFGIVIYVGTRPVDYLNRVLMIGLLLSYGALIFFGSFYIQKNNLMTHQWKYAFGAIPILIISFGFHNMIPSLAGYFHGDAKRLRTTLLIGSLCPLVIYLLWEFVMLGIIPVGGCSGLMQALDQGQAATQALKGATGLVWMSTIGQTFALFAIITSFLAQSLSLVDFLADGLKVPKIKWGRRFLLLLTLAPPFVLAFLYPGIFIRALNFAGGFSAVILFGAMPALMVWSLRYRKNIKMVKILPTGRFLFISILIIATVVFLIELLTELGLFNCLHEASL